MRNLFHFRSFFNFLSRNKLFTAINVFGFAVSLMFVMLLGLYVQDELSVDSFHDNRARIYRIEYNEGVQLAPGLAGVVAANYPEIEAWTRVYTKDRYTLDPVAGYTTEMVDARVLLADSTFFRIFSFPFVEGDPSTVMHTWDDVVLTESFARRLFGTEPALGKVVTTRGISYVVSGVVRDFEHTHFRNPEMIVPIDNWLRTAKSDPASLARQMGMIGNNNDMLVYLMGRENTDLAARLDTAELNRYFTQELKLPMFVEGVWNHPHLNRLEDIYLTSNDPGTHGNSPVYLLILAGTALLILLFAVINYINLSVAQSGFRAQEAAMRLLLGGSRRQLFGNFVMEALLVCLVSFGLALLLVSAVEPWFREVLQTRVSLAQGVTWKNAALAAGIVLAVGGLAGLTPAYVLTRFKP
ncbi:MAG: ABC transporter permease, partial [Rikenellaceae bacterium]|nr:ABC transporter permease [Rikenellaceae bacterium]